MRVCVCACMHLCMHSCLNVCSRVACMYNCRKSEFDILLFYFPFYVISDTLFSRNSWKWIDCNCLFLGVQISQAKDSLGGDHEIISVVGHAGVSTTQ